MRLLIVALLTMIFAGCDQNTTKSTPTLRPPFRDASADVGIQFEHENGMSGEFYMVEMVGPGGAWFDYDNDGDMDVYITQGHLLTEDAVEHAKAIAKHSDRLYRNDLVVHPDGTRELKFTDVTSESQITGGGYGLGLYLCRVIAQAHGGRLHIDSRPGQGTTIRVTIPLGEAWHAH